MSRLCSGVGVFFVFHDDSLLLPRLREALTLLEDVFQERARRVILELLLRPRDERIVVTASCSFAELLDELHKPGIVPAEELIDPPGCLPEMWSIFDKNFAPVKKLIHL